jgi:hypothetical protein
MPQQIFTHPTLYEGGQQRVPPLYGWWAHPPEDIWSAGHLVSGVVRVQSVAQLVTATAAQDQQARAATAALLR